MRAILIFAVFAIAVPDRPDPTPKQPNNQLVGEWVNRSHPASVLRIMPSESVFILRGQPSLEDGFTAAYVVDWSKNPVTIDFTAKHDGRKIECILKVEGDRLSVAQPLNNDPRPASFAGAQAVQHYQRLIEK